MFSKIFFTLSLIIFALTIKLHWPHIPIFIKCCNVHFLWLDSFMGGSLIAGATEDLKFNILYNIIYSIMYRYSFDNLLQACNLVKLSY